MASGVTGNRSRSLEVLLLLSSIFADEEQHSSSDETKHVRSRPACSYERHTRLLAALHSLTDAGRMICESLPSDCMECEREQAVDEVHAAMLL